ncbi:hypothetical protein [Nonomuraea angiospora]|uniref:hypothetical protein n=1 Tax=Nonomuraea angiospora TaxID=46172 RepID=UPI0029A79349|nr:hypothetical protein [Nonomuraea angiospora]MDX3109704.1 hypothetical protein [Nonomuraea angiospora]
MRGKKAAGAAIRKDHAELERRAARAEHAERRLTGELSELKERTNREIHALRTALAEANRQRDETVNPLLLAAEERIRVLSAELLEVRADHERTTSAYQKLCNGIMRGSFKEGLTPAEGRRRIANLSGENFIVRDRDEPEHPETDPQRAAFQRAMEAKNRDAANRQLAGGAKVRVTATVAAAPGAEA